MLFSKKLVIDVNHAIEYHSAMTFAMLALLAALSAHDGQHDFDFHFGTWKTHLRRLSGGKWIELEGVTKVTPVLGGAANMVELEAGDFKGLSLRLYNPGTKQWSLNYANARDGQLATPTVGAFANGQGTFYDDEVIDGKPVRVRFIITPVSKNEVHFEQAVSSDGGRTWEMNWVAVDTRK